MVRSWSDERSLHSGGREFLHTRDQAFRIGSLAARGENGFAYTGTRTTEQLA
jgi:hypothetical protein